MPKINFSNLPEIIYMEDLSTALGLKGRLDVGSVNQIILASKCNELPIYFDDAMHGAIYADTHGIEDEDGEITEVIANGVDIDAGRKTLLHGLTYPDKLAVAEFKYKSTEYYSVNKQTDYLEPRHLYIGRFYCDREELIASGLLSKSTTVSNNKKNVPVRAKKQSIQEKRIDAFKQWLKTVSKMQATNPSQYQDCYMHMNEPTRDSVWKSLQKVNPRLFASGKDGFFKKQDIVNFTRGTGENRYKQT